MESIAVMVSGGESVGTSARMMHREEEREVEEEESVMFMLHCPLDCAAVKPTNESIAIRPANSNLRILRVTRRRGKAK